jgi:hypothetical protein
VKLIAEQLVIPWFYNSLNQRIDNGLIGVKTIVQESYVAFTVKTYTFLPLSSAL